MKIFRFTAKNLTFVKIFTFVKLGPGRQLKVKFLPYKGLKKSTDRGLGPHQSTPVSYNVNPLAPVSTYLDTRMGYKHTILMYFSVF